MRKRSALLLLLMLLALQMEKKTSCAFTRAVESRAASAESRAASAALAERLGFKASDKILIINVDDVAGSHAANAAAIDALENGLATSATIMVPCPWFPEIAAYARTRPRSDFGLHLTHTSEWRGYKWGPV